MHRVPFLGYPHKRLEMVRDAYPTLFFAQQLRNLNRRLQRPTSCLARNQGIFTCFNAVDEMFNLFQQGIAAFKHGFFGDDFGNTREHFPSM
jgi:hypothetical protein